MIVIKQKYQGLFPIVVGNKAIMFVEDEDGEKVIDNNILNWPEFMNDVKKQPDLHNLLKRNFVKIKTGKRKQFKPKRGVPGSKKNKDIK